MLFHAHPSTESEIDTLTVVAYPGAGKGTVLEGLIHHLDADHRKHDLFEVGQMVRGHIHSGSEFGRQAVDFSKKGLLVPDDLIVPPIRAAIAELDNESLWLLDGFPRNGMQIQPYEEEMEKYRRRYRALRLQLGRDEKDERQVAEERMRKRGENALERKKKDPTVKVRNDDVDPAARAKRLDEAAMLREVMNRDQCKGLVITIDATKNIQYVRSSTWSKVSAYMLKRHAGSAY